MERNIKKGYKHTTTSANVTLSTVENAPLVQYLMRIYTLESISLKGCVKN